MQKLSALIVDDEMWGRKNLEKLLLYYCPEIQIIGMASSAAEAKTIVEQQTPDIIFLDIEMPNVNGFQFLDSFTERNFSVIFVTAYSRYALQAIKASAVDYILKPINIQELQNAVQKSCTIHTLKKSHKTLQKNYRASVTNLLNEIQKEQYPDKITLPHSEEYRIVNVKDIIRLEGDDNYTHIYCFNQKPVLASKTLREFEELFDTTKFFRIHKSHIINLAYLKSYSSRDGGFVTMFDGVKLPISRRRYTDFLDVVKNSAPLIQ